MISQADKELLDRVRAKATAAGLGPRSLQAAANISKNSAAGILAGRYPTRNPNDATRRKLLDYLGSVTVSDDKPVAAQRDWSAEEEGFVRRARALEAEGLAAQIRAQAVLLAEQNEMLRQLAGVAIARGEPLDRETLEFAQKALRGAPSPQPSRAKKAATQ